MCCQSVWSQEARNSWTTLPSDYSPDTTLIQSDENLNWLLDELLALAKSTHPNSKQASCIWLLAVIKGVGDKLPVKEKLQQIQDIFMDLLCENNGRILFILITYLMMNDMNIREPKFF